MTGLANSGLGSSGPGAQVVTRLEMDRIEGEVRELEAAIDGARAQVRLIVDRMRTAPDDSLRYLIAERLPALGSAVLPAVQEILVDPASGPGLRYCAARVAVSVGDRGDCVDVLRREVDADSEWSLPAAGVLARYGIREATGEIVSALARTDPTNVRDIVGYATALRDLGGALPNVVRCHIQEASPSWVAQMIEVDFPEQGQ